VKNIIKSGNATMDMKRFQKKMKYQMTQLQLNEKKTLSKAGKSARNEIQKEQRRLAGSASTKGNPYIGKKSRPSEFVEQLTRWRYSARAAGKRIPHVKVGIFPGKAGPGSKAIKNNAFRHMGFKTLKSLANAMILGKKLRITPQNRKRMVREAAKPGSKMHFVKKSTKFIRFNPINYLPFIPRNVRKWQRQIKEDISKRLIKTFTKIK